MFKTSPLVEFFKYVADKSKVKVGLIMNKIKLAVSLSVLGFIAVIFQNFTPVTESIKSDRKEASTSLGAALAAASQQAEEDKKSKQVALQVDNANIKKSYWTRERNPTSIVDRNDPLKVEGQDRSDLKSESFKQNNVDADDTKIIATEAKDAKNLKEEE